MIARVLDLAKRRGATADALLRDTTALSLRYETGRLKETELSQEAGVNLRVLASGRVGVAGTTDLTAYDDVVERAFASAAEGEELRVELPGPASLPEAATFDDRAAGLGVAALAELGREVVALLERPLWQVHAQVDRTVETTTFASTTGQSFTYRSTAVSVSAEITRVAGDDVLIVGDSLDAAGVPSREDLERMTRQLAGKVERADRIVEPPEGRLPVLFTPEGSAAVLMPLRQALSGKTVLQGISPLGGKLGEAMFDTLLTVTDEPLLPTRLGTRPADDEGVPSKPLPLIERGTVRAFVYDLETASRAGVPPTGHGQRSTFNKPAISFSNLVIRAGTLDEAGLQREMERGLVVEDLIGVGQGNVIGGAFSHPVALAWRVEGGEIVGRVKDAAVAGNAYELLRQIRALGREVKWIGGSRAVPPLVLDGVSVARR
jgi:PmbA protein